MASMEGKSETRMNGVSPAALAAFPLASMYMGDLAGSGLQISVQLLYLGGILTLLGGAGYLVVRQVAPPRAPSRAGPSIYPLPPRACAKPLRHGEGTLAPGRGRACIAQRASHALALCLTGPPGAGPHPPRA